MEIDNKYIHAKPIGDIKDEPAYAIVNNKSGKEIACISYYPPWRRYVMVTDSPAVFDVNCLESIIKFINSRWGNEVESDIEL